jgi:hypothetical protein
MEISVISFWRDLQNIRLPIFFALSHHWLLGQDQLEIILLFSQ